MAQTEVFAFAAGGRRESWPLARADAASAADPGDVRPEAEEGAEAAENPEPVGLSLAEAFRAAAKKFGTREVVLALPLSRLLVKVVRVPAENAETAPDEAGAMLDKTSPFPDEELMVGMETVSENDREIVALVAALPEATSAEIGEALDAAKLRVTRTDAMALGWLRALWPRLAREGAPRRQVALLDLDDGWDVVVVDGGSPSVVRGLGAMASAEDLGREVTLTLLQAPFGPEVGEIVVFSRTEPDADATARLSAFGTVRHEKVEDAFGGVEGVAWRTAEACLFDVTPEAWSRALAETRFKRKMMGWVAAAGVLWLGVMGVLFGVPFAYDQMTAHEKQLSKKHEKAYNEVKGMRERVKLVQRYSDHARGSLEMLRMVSERLPEGIVLTSFDYVRDDKLSVSGEAEDAEAVYKFKNAIVDAKTFAEVELRGPTARGEVQKFSIEAFFVAKEDRK